MELIHAPIGNWDGVFGLQFRNRDFASNGEEAFVPSSKHGSIALFALEKGDYGHWHFEVGGRYEHESSENTVSSLNVDHGAWNLSGGAGWEYAEDYRVGLAVTRAERVPSIEELFANGPHLASNSFEIGSAASMRRHR